MKIVHFRLLSMLLIFDSRRCLSLAPVELQGRRRDAVVREGPVRVCRRVRDAAMLQERRVRRRQVPDV